MHELSIMENALALVRRQAEAAHAARVHVICLRVGAVSGVAPEALELAFGALAPGTIAEGARLVIESVPATFYCVECQREFVSKSMLAECEDCHTFSRDMRSGRELEVASLEIE